MKKNFLLLLPMLLIYGLNAEAQEIRRMDVGFEKIGLPLQNAFAGGLNSPQINAVDLDNDGILDLHFFDRAGNVHVTFKNNGSTNGDAYTFAPELAEGFPEINNWALLRDYNGDGVMDIYSYSDLPGIHGVKVHTGSYVDGKLSFERFDHWEGPHNLISFLKFNSMGNPSYPQLAITNEDLPAIADVDGDGDIDILTFDLGGSFVEWYKNMSVEMGYGLDSLIYDQAELCWGNFKEGGLSAEIFLGTNTGICPNFTNPIVDTRHSGSTLMTYDKDNDGAVELVLGDLTGENLVELENAGNANDAFMDAVDSNFPSDDVPADMPIFLASFHLDLDNDGILDLVVAPNNSKTAEDDQNIWFYKNENNNEFPDFNFQQNDFLVETMIDNGTGANPAFVDFNADGLMDFVVGNISYFLPAGEKDARLFLYENIGTLDAPKYKLADDNWLSMNQYTSTSSYFNYSPTFGDLDNDGDLDLMVGEETGRLIYFENTAGVGNPLAYASPDLFFQSIDAGQGINPQIIDVNRDGLKDLLIGWRLGKVFYMPNTGTATSPQFESDPFAAPNDPNFGGIDTRIQVGFDGSASPTMIDMDGEYVMYVATQRGRIEVYNNIDGNLDGDFVMIDSTFGNIKEGQLTHMDIVDINGNGKMEYLVGNSRGGLGFFTADGPTSINNPNLNSSLEIKVMPNPTNDFVYFDLEGFKHGITELRVFDAIGRVVLQKSLPYKKTGIDVSGLSAGVYFCEVMVGSERGIVKLVKKLNPDP